MTRPAVLTEGLTKCFGPVTAVDGLDLEVQGGEVFGFLGPNGAGKTTTIRLLLDLVRPTSGRCEVLGESGASVEVRRRIGYLPADLHFDNRWTGGDVFEFHGRLHGGIDATETKRLCTRFDLDPKRPIGELSTGNRRKVGIVQAFVHQPDLLILDEPTTGLDPLLQYELHALMHERADAGATIFLSSHVLPEVERVVRRVGIVRAGRLVTVASIEELRSRARHIVELHLAHDAEPARYHGLPGVVEAEVDGPEVRLVVEGSIDAVIKAAAHDTVERIVTRQSDLEEIFLAYYRSDDQP